MRNCTNHIIFAISFFLVFSLILDAFADDDRYRKRHRYRGGSQKVDDDSDDYDRHEYLKPVTNQVYGLSSGSSLNIESVPATVPVLEAAGQK